MTTRDACGACIAALVGRPGEGAGFQRGLLEGRLLPGERLPGSMRGDDERRVSVQRRSVLISTGDWVGLCRARTCGRGVGGVAVHSAAVAG